MTRPSICLMHIWWVWCVSWLAALPTAGVLAYACGLVGHVGMYAASFRCPCIMVGQ